MSIHLNYQLREYVPHNSIEFPITYFSDELAALPDWAGPVHWHPDFEIATAECGVLDYQVGNQHIILEAGDSIFVNGNMLHGIKQVRNGDHNRREINSLIKDTYRQMNDKQTCYELAVQRNISGIFEFISRNFANLPKTEYCQSSRYQSK